MIRWNFINLQHTRQDGDSLTNASVAERSEVWMQARPKDHDGSILGLALGSRRCDIRPSDATLARQATHLSALQWLISHTFSSLVSPRCLLWYQIPVVPYHWVLHTRHDTLFSYIRRFSLRPPSMAANYWYMFTTTVVWYHTSIRERWYHYTLPVSTAVLHYGGQVDA